MLTKATRQEIRERLDGIASDLPAFFNNAQVDIGNLLDDLDEWDHDLENCLLTLRECARFNEAEQVYDVQVSVALWNQIYERGGWSPHERCKRDTMARRSKG